MAHLTLEVPDELAERIRAMETWFPTILELSLLGFETPATATAKEVVQFLSQAPPPQDVLAFHASKRSQERLQRLLTLNQAGILSETEQCELDELQRIEHIVIMLKAQIANQVV